MPDDQKPDVLPYKRKRGLFAREFVITGADQASGEDVTRTIEANSEAEARAEASRLGILVETVQRIRVAEEDDRPTYPLLVITSNIMILGGAIAGLGCLIGTVVTRDISLLVGVGAMIATMIIGDLIRVLRDIAYNSWGRR